MDYVSNPQLIYLVASVSDTGESSEDLNAHLTSFIELCETVSIRNNMQFICDYFHFLLQEMKRSGCIVITQERSPSGMIWSTLFSFILSTQEDHKGKKFNNTKF